MQYEPFPIVPDDDIMVKMNYLFYDEPGPLSLLLSNLLHFNSLCELFAKGQMCLKEHKTVNAPSSTCNRKYNMDTLGK